jgi:hypothetical protein
MRDDNDVYYKNCIAGNIIDQYYYGVDKEIKRGTSYFIPNTKVYCGLGYVNASEPYMRVLGKSRKSFRMIDVIINAKYIKNFRVEKTYNPKILKFLKATNWNIYTYEIQEDYLKNLNTFNIEIKGDGGLTEIF